MRDGRALFTGYCLACRGPQAELVAALRSADLDESSLGKVMAGLAGLGVRRVKVKARETTWSMSLLGDAGLGSRRERSRECARYALARRRWPDDSMLEPRSPDVE